MRPDHRPLAVLLIGLAATFAAAQEPAAPGIPAAPLSATAPDTAPAHPVGEKGSYDLDKVTVTAGARRLSRKETEHVARMPLRNLENPQAYTVVPKELTREQVAVDYRSAFKNVPGAGPANIATNGRNLFTSRGFQAANLIRNGMVSWVYSDVDPANLERIEAIRGPSGALFGGAVISYGGLFNRVTKRPSEVYGGEIAFSGGSWDLARYAADVNLPLNAERTALLRVNAAAHEEQSFQDAGYTKSYALAPSFAYRVDDRLSFLLDAEWYEREATGVVTSFTPTGITNADRMDQVDKDPKRSFTNNTLNGSFPTYNFNGQIDYVMLPGWTSRTQYAASRFINDEDGIWGFAAISNELAVRRYGEGRWKRNSQHVQQNVLGDFRLGPVRNRLLMGVDLYYVNSRSTDRSGVLDTVNFVNPGPEYLNTATFNARRTAEAYPVNVSSSESYTYGAYVSDVINPVDRLSILLGLRFDKFDNRGNLNVVTGAATGIYEQKAWSPKAGIVYEAVKDQLSLFANYLNGFRNVAGADFAGNSFDPEQANQWEFGVKAEALRGKLVGTVSYYDITVDDMVRADPDHPNFSKQDGSQVSRGVEAELSANPADGLSLVAGYAYNDSYMEKAAESVNGRRPTSAGAEHAANLWASYRLVSGPARGLGIGAGMNYFGEQYVINTATRQFTVPEYTTIDATVFYDRAAYRIGLKVDNLTDVVYWNAWGAPQPSRRFIGNVAYKF